MQRTSPIIAACALIGLPSAALGDLILDLSGMQSWELDADPLNELRVFDLGPAPTGFGHIILEIRYDITIQTFASSWLSDVNIRFGNSDGTFHGDWPDTFAPGAGLNTGGTQRFTGSFFTDIHLNDDNAFHIELFESVNDVAGGPDAILLDGSTMTLVPFIPAPGTAPVLAFGLLSLGSRRQR